MSEQKPKSAEQPPKPWAIWAPFPLTPSDLISCQVPSHTVSFLLLDHSRRGPTSGSLLHCFTGNLLLTEKHRTVTSKSLLKCHFLTTLFGMDTYFLPHASDNQLFSLDHLSVCLCMSVRVLSCFSCVQAPLSMGFPRQEYWSDLPFPPPSDLPNPGIELTSLESPV